MNLATSLAIGKSRMVVCNMVDILPRACHGSVLQEREKSEDVDRLEERVHGLAEVGLP